MEQQRTAWSDERLDDLSRRIDAGFERMDRDIRDLRFDLGTQIEGLRQMTLRVGGGMLLGFISVLAAILVRGA